MSIKLIDFNLARKPAGGLSKLFGGKTKVIQGTHSYMSPEQIRGQSLDVRADVYSFGCMVHEFFSGKPPFTANSPNELLQRHLTSEAAAAHACSTRTSRPSSPRTCSG